MFDASVYKQRRDVLRSRLDKGIILIFANDESPANYRDNPYPFRQDSTFLYYFGLNDPGMIGVIDLDEGKDSLFGYEYTMDDTIWMGPQPSLTARGALCGVGNVVPAGKSEEVIRAWKKAGRALHFLPPYRADHELKIQSMLNIPPAEIPKHASTALIKAIIDQRSVKTDAELAEIELAHAVTRDMHRTAMEETRPGLYEYEIVAKVKSVAFSGGGGPSFTVIFSVHGETLHNHAYGNRMAEGQLVVHDSGAETAAGYAADITRTFPVSGKFTAMQRGIYEIVLEAEKSCVSAVKPGVTNREVHLLAARIITEGLKTVGLMKGNVDSAVEQGAHALFFPHGIGHMMGLDVHDMENLGENFVGYDAESERSKQFGLASLRLAKALQPGYVLTIEPGIYFIPALIDKWHAENSFRDFINYQALDKYRGFGGVRIEDDVVVTKTGGRVIGKPIPKEPEEVEQACRR
jgi:Xaa-Pro aminopeptidase